MDNIEIQILDSDNNVTGVLTVADDDKFPLSLTKGIANLKNINERSGSYSTSFKIASTKDNDVLLEHLYYASEKNYKDWDADKRARIIVNGLDIDTGRLRVDRVSAKGDARDYNFTFFGDNMDWVLLMQDKYFSDLPYLDQSILWDATTVENSWTATAGNNVPVFSIINRGQRFKPDMVSISDCYPDYFTYDVIKDAFNSIGFKVESTFIEQAHFKKLITPFFGSRFKLTEEQTEAENVFVDMDSSVTNVDSSISNTGYYSFNFLLDSSYSTPTNLNPETNQANVAGFTETTPYYDNGANWGSIGLSLGGTTYAYTAPNNGYYKMELDTSCTSYSSTGHLPTSPFYKIYRKVGSTAIGTIGNLNNVSVNTNVYSSGGINYKDTWGIYESAFVYLNAGESITIGGSNAYSGSLGDFSFGLKHYTNTTIKVTYSPNIVAGNTFNWKNVSDNEISLLKYITDLGKLHNWYFRTNTATRTVYIETRDSFYNALSTATNWTDKIDDNKQHELYYNSRYYSQLQGFKYAEDGDDEFIEWWNDRTGDEFQNLTHEYPEKFKDGKTTLQLDVIAPTISSQDAYTGGNEPIFSFMWDKNPTESIPPLRLNYKPRLLYYNYSTQQDVDGVTKEFYWNNESTPRTTIPYALSFSRVVNNVVLADVAGSLDFKDLTSFWSTGAILDTSITQDGLHTNYYQKTTREIEEGRRLNINLYLDLVDYKNISLREIIYFDNRYPDIEGYWRIEKISNFKPIGTQSTSLELIQAKNFLPKTYTQSGGGVITDYSEGLSSFRLANTVDNSKNISDKQPNVVGSRNVVEPNTTVIGDYLESSAPFTTRMGVYNLDVSTDTFQLGVGTKNESFSLIRADEAGNILFNGELIRGGLYDSTKIVTKTANFTASVLTETYLCDTSSNDIDVTFPATIKIGKVWNFKKMSGNNILELRADFDNTTNLTITNQYDNARVQWDGTQFLII